MSTMAQPQPNARASRLAGNENLTDGRTRRYQAARDFVLPQMVRARAEAEPTFPMFQQVGGAATTAEEFHLNTVRLAGALDRDGVDQGECVATMLKASRLSFEAWLAIGWLRALEVAINPELRGTTLVHHLNDCRATFLIVSSDYLPRLAEVATRLDFLKRVIVVDDLPQGSQIGPLSVESFHDFVADAPILERDGPRESDPGAVVYTSGTTGPSKGVIRPWGLLHSSTIDTNFINDREEDYDDPAMYSAWSTFHSSGRASALIALQWGLRLVQRDRFSLSSFWNDIREYRCTHTLLIAVGPKLWQARREEDRHNTLKRAFMIPMVEDIQGFEEFFDLRLSTAWGMTEIGLPLAIERPVDPRSCGRIVPGYEVRLVDSEDYPVSAGEVGELIVRHDKPWRMMSGYLGRPEETAAAWRNGWLHTGDALREGPNGEYYFVDRIKDYVRYRGNNVSSIEVEVEVQSHPDVEECACIGVPGDEDIDRLDTDTKPIVGDEEIKVFVVLREGSELAAEDLVDYLKDRMPRYMVPRYIEFISSLPRTQTHKIRKSDLRNMEPTANAWDRLAVGIQLEL